MNTAIPAKSMHASPAMPNIIINILTMAPKTREMIFEIKVSMNCPISNVLE